MKTATTPSTRPNPMGWVCLALFAVILVAGNVGVLLALILALVALGMNLIRLVQGSFSIGRLLGRRTQSNKLVERLASANNTDRWMQGLSVLMLGTFAYNLVVTLGNSGTWPDDEQFSKHVALILLAPLCFLLSRPLFKSQAQLQTRDHGITLVHIGIVCAISSIAIAPIYTVLRELLFGQSSISFFGTRIEFTVLNKLLFSQVWAVAGGLSLVGWHQSGSFGRVVRVLGYGAALYSVALLAQSRMPTLALGLVGIVSLLGCLMGPHLYLKRAIILVPVVLGLALSGLTFTWLVGSWADIAIVARFESAVTQLLAGKQTLTEASSFHRFIMFDAAAALIAERPLLGYGLVEHSALLASVHDLPRAYSHWHSLYLNQLIGGGAIGLTLILAIICWPLISALSCGVQRSNTDVVFAGLNLAILWLVMGLTNSIFAAGLSVTTLLFSILIVTASTQVRS